MNTRYRLLCICLFTASLPVFAACSQVSSLVETRPVPETTQSGDLKSLTSTPPKVSPPTSTFHKPSSLGLDASSVRGQVVRFWHFWNGSAGELIRELVDEFNLSNEWRITVVAEEHAGMDDLASKMDMALRTNQLPDLIVAAPYQVQAWDSDERIVDLQPYLADSVWGFTAQEQEDFFPAFWSPALMEDKHRGIPAQRSGVLLYYNRSWARELGFSVPPTTPQQFKEQACAAAQANREDDSPDNDGTGGWIVSSNYSATLGWILAFGGDITPVKGAGNDEEVYQFATPQANEAFIFLRDLYDSQCAWITESQYPDVDFVARRGLFATDSLVAVPYYTEAFQQAGNTDQWTVLVFPSKANQPSFPSFGSDYVMFTSFPERQLAAWLFIKWLSAPQIQARLVENTGAFPLRASTSNRLQGYKNRYPQWATAVDALSAAEAEPAYASWSTVRWALSDATTQLFRSYFSIDQVSALLSYLQRTAAELHAGLEAGGATPATPPGFLPVTPQASTSHTLAASPTPSPPTLTPLTSPTPPTATSAP